MNEKKITTDLFGNIIISDADNVYVQKITKQKDLSNEIEVDYIIEIVCKTEKEQELLYNELTKQGKICRLLTL